MAMGQRKMAMLHALCVKGNAGAYRRGSHILFLYEQFTGYIRQALIANAYTSNATRLKLVLEPLLAALRRRASKPRLPRTKVSVGDAHDCRKQASPPMVCIMPKRYCRRR